MENTSKIVFGNANDYHTYVTGEECDPECQVVFGVAVVAVHEPEAVKVAVDQWGPDLVFYGAYGDLCTTVNDVVYAWDGNSWCECG